MKFVNFSLFIIKTLLIYMIYVYDAEFFNDLKSASYGSATGAACRMRLYVFGGFAGSKEHCAFACRLPVPAKASDLAEDRAEAEPAGEVHFGAGNNHERRRMVHP